MALVECRECKKEISDQAKTCPSCGAKQGKSAWPAILIFLGVMFVLVLIFGATHKDDGRSLERDAIDLCWKEQERKSLTAGEAQFIAGACEKMEDDFRTKYRVNP